MARNLIVHVDEGPALMCVCVCVCVGGQGEWNDVGETLLFQ